MVTGITGSTGQVGRLVAEQLAAEGRALRLIVRDPSRAPALPRAQISVASYDDRAELRAALAGVDAVLMVSASESRDRRHQHRSFVEAAADAGVEHLVYTSFIGASPGAVFTLGRDHGDTEEAIRASGLGYTLLRDNFYADLLPQFADAEGVIRGPAGAGRVAAVARLDVAEVAATVLSQPEAHRDAVYALTGPEAVSLSALAARAARFFGRNLRFEDETVPQAYASRAHYGVEQWQLDAWVSTYLAIAQGEVAEVSDDIEQITGKPARTLEQAWASVRV